MAPGPGLPGRSLRRLLWKCRAGGKEEEVGVLVVDVVLRKARAAGSRALVGVWEDEADRPARTAGTRALCTVVSDIFFSAANLTFVVGANWVISPCCARPGIACCALMDGELEIALKLRVGDVSAGFSPTCAWVGRFGPWRGSTAKSRK